MSRAEVDVVSGILINFNFSVPIGILRIKMKGCFTDMHECNQTECVTSAEPRQGNIHFCCCKGSRCNSNQKYIKSTTEATTQGGFGSGFEFRFGLTFAATGVLSLECLPQFCYFSVCIYFLFVFVISFFFFFLYFYCIFKLQNEGVGFAYKIPLLASEAAFFVLTNS